MENIDIFNFWAGMFFIVAGLGFIVYGIWEIWREYKKGR